MKFPDETMGKDITGDGKQQLVKLFASPLDYANYLESIPHCVWPSQKYGHSTYDTYIRNAIAGMRSGDTRAAEMAEEIVSQLEDEQVFSDGLPQPAAQIVGGFTITQLYNQGIPTCMLRYDTSHLKGLNTPLTVYFDAYGSIGLGEDLAMKRGVACLAFVMALSRVRPVEMYVITCTSPVKDSSSLYGALVKVPTNPLDLSRIGFMMTDYNGYIKYGRWLQMTWQYIRHNNAHKQYYEAMGPFGGNISGEYIKEAYKQAFNAGPDDIVLYGTQTTAPRIHNVRAAHDPVNWVRAMMKLHRDKQENEQE